jgi:hypothetical protein
METKQPEPVDLLGTFSPVDPSPLPLADDKLRGVKKIAAHIGEPERRTQYLCEKRLIPCGKEGAHYVASKRQLDAHYAALASGRAA